VVLFGEDHGENQSADSGARLFVSPTNEKLEFALQTLHAVDSHQEILAPTGLFPRILLNVGRDSQKQITTNGKLDIHQLCVDSERLYV